jgi:hypothetical protein
MFDRPRTTYLLCRSIGRSRIHATLQALKAFSGARRTGINSAKISRQQGQAAEPEGEKQ